MRRWWALARGEWLMLANIAGGVLGIQLAAVLQAEGITAWAVWLAAVFGLGGLAQYATRNHGTADLPTVGSLAYYLVGVPVLVVWWFLLGGVMNVPSDVGLAYCTFFVAGVLVTRIVVRMVSDYVAADGGRPNPRLRVPRSPF